MPRWRLFYHLVWATKDREPLISGDRDGIVHRRLREIAERNEIIVHAVGGIDDHVHMAVSIPPAMAVATAIQRIKGASSRVINEEIGDVFGWQAEYAVDTFSERHLGQVVACIANQRRHHTDGSVWSSIELVPDTEHL